MSKLSVHTLAPLARLVASSYLSVYITLHANLTHATELVAAAESRACRGTFSLPCQSNAAAAEAAA
jgi:hypothetical protein